MRFDGRSLRWLLPVLLILSTAAPMAAQGTNQPSAGDTANLIKQAESGDAKAQCDLGVAYHNGEGVAKDEAAAVRWFRKAAEQGYAKAQYDFGQMYDRGEGVPKDEAEAARWYRKAAEQGLAHAQYNLGMAYLYGEGVPKDGSEAYFWLILSASSLDEKARETRDQVGVELSRKKRLEVQERCRKWVEAHPQNHS